MPFTRVLLILMCLPALVAHAENASARELRIISMEIGDGLQMSDSPGLYGELIAHILENADVEYDFQVYPFRRALRVFFSREADCVWALDSGALEQFNEQNERFLDSEALFTSTQHVFMAPGAPAIASLSDLRGKRVALFYHSSMLEEFEELSVELVTVADNSSKVRLLVNKRVDAVIGWIPDILVAFRIVGADPVWINPVLKITEVDVGIACHENDKTRAFLANVDVVIRNFAGSPEFQNIMDKYGAMLPKRLGD